MTPDHVCVFVSKKASEGNQESLRAHADFRNFRHKLQLFLVSYGLLLYRYQYELKEQAP